MHFCPLLDCLSRVMRCWSCSVPGWGRRSGSTRLESHGCCRTTLSWRRRISLYRNLCQHSNKIRYRWFTHVPELQQKQFATFTLSQLFFIPLLGGVWRPEAWAQSPRGGDRAPEQPAPGCSALEGHLRQSFRRGTGVSEERAWTEDPPTARAGPPP